jgi:hypothetical protein
MGARVIIEWQGLDAAISRLTEIGEKAPQGVEHQMAALANATEEVWKEHTPRRTETLEEGDVVEPDGLSFTLKNSVYYYKFVDEGHNTPKGWRTKHGYRLAKRRSHVAAREMTSKTMQFVAQNIVRYLSKFLDNV